MRQVVSAYIAWTTSSSGCEQMFAQLKRSPAELASSRGDTDRRLAVIVGSDPQFDDAVVQKARELYGILLPSGRARTNLRKTRIDAGCAGKQKPTSKQAWIRKRKAAVDQAAQEEELCTPPKRPSLELPESVAKEQSKQRALQMKRKAEAYLEGTLVAKEATQEVKDAADMKQKIDGANDRDRARKFADASAKLVVRQKKQDVAWALKKLPQPATLLDVAPGLVAATQQKLKQTGVATFVQDRGSICFYVFVHSWRSAGFIR